MAETAIIAMCNDFWSNCNALLISDPIVFHHAGCDEKIFRSLWQHDCVAVADTRAAHSNPCVRLPLLYDPLQHRFVTPQAAATDAENFASKVDLDHEQLAETGWTLESKQVRLCSFCCRCYVLPVIGTCRSCRSNVLCFSVLLILSSGNRNLRSFEVVLIFRSVFIISLLCPFDHCAVVERQRPGRTSCSVRRLPCHEL